MLTSPQFISSTRTRQVPTTFQTLFEKLGNDREWDKVRLSPGLYSVEADSQCDGRRRATGSKVEQGKALAVIRNSLQGLTWAVGPDEVMQGVMQINRGKNILEGGDDKCQVYEAGGSGECSKDSRRVSGGLGGRRNNVQGWGGWTDPVVL